MGRNDIRIRRNVFRSGKIASKRDFKRFENSFNSRKNREARSKTIILMVAILILTVILIFSVRAFSYEPETSLPEQTITVENKIL